MTKPDLETTGNKWCLSLSRASLAPGSTTAIDAGRLETGSGKWPVRASSPRRDGGAVSTKHRRTRGLGDIDRWTRGAVGKFAQPRSGCLTQAAPDRPRISHAAAAGWSAVRQTLETSAVRRSLSVSLFLYISRSLGYRDARLIVYYMGIK